MSNLNEDCLMLILCELIDDGNSLFSCLLVNRFWCKTVVPILWKNPWKFIRYQKRKIKLFFHNFFLHTSENTFNPEKKREPLFDYIGYCNYIEHRVIYDYIRQLYEDESNQRNILEEIYKILMSKCKRIDCLNMDCGMNLHVHEFTGSNDCLPVLYELHCHSNIDPLIFYGLAQKCRFIEKFNIVFSGDNPGLARLIEIQQKVIDLRLYFDNNYENCERNSRAIVKHTQTLHRLDLNINVKHDSILKILPKSINLKKLSLNNCYNNLQLETYLLISKFSKLQELEIYFMSFQSIINILEKTQGSLWKIVIPSTGSSISSLPSPIGPIDGFNSGKLMRALYRHCPNIKYATIYINQDDDFNEFEKFLVNCQHLESLFVESSHYKYVNVNDIIDKLLETLIRFAPINLFKIGFQDDIKFTIESLELFFQKWKGRKSLCLFPISLKDEKMSVELDNLIAKYKNEGVIKI